MRVSAIVLAIGAATALGPSHPQTTQKKTLKVIVAFSDFKAAGDAGGFKANSARTLFGVVPVSAAEAVAGKPVDASSTPYLASYEFGAIDVSKPDTWQHEFRVPIDASADDAPTFEVVGLIWFNSPDHPVQSAAAAMTITPDRKDWALLKGREVLDQLGDKIVDFKCEGYGGNDKTWLKASVSLNSLKIE